MWRRSSVSSLLWGILALRRSTVRLRRRLLVITTLLRRGLPVRRVSSVRHCTRGLRQVKFQRETDKNGSCKKELVKKSRPQLRVS